MAEALRLNRVTDGQALPETRSLNRPSRRGEDSLTAVRGARGSRSRSRSELTPPRTPRGARRCISGAGHRRQQQETTAKLAEPENKIDESQRNVDALRAVMPRATELLEYIAMHAGHALDRWETETGQTSLGPDAEHRYNGSRKSQLHNLLSPISGSRT